LNNLNLINEERNDLINKIKLFLDNKINETNNYINGNISSAATIVFDNIVDYGSSMTYSQNCDIYSFIDI
jgi:hypothetical protein